MGAACGEISHNSLMSCFPFQSAIGVYCSTYFREMTLAKGAVMVCSICLTLCSPRDGTYDGCLNQELVHKCLT